MTTASSDWTLCLLGVIWFAVMGDIPGTTSTDRQPAVITSAEENAVFRALADQYYKHPVGVPFLIESETIVPERLYEDRNAERIRRDSDGALFDEYRRRSGERVVIRDSVAIPGMVLVTDSVRAAIADSLRQRQSSIGVHSFSRVGFTSTRDSALVFTFRHCGMLCGKGGLFLLEKRDGKWLVLRQLYAVAS